MKKLEADSVHAYIELINEIVKKNTYTVDSPSAYNGRYLVEPMYVFRGHSNENDYKLVPGIFRKRKMEDKANCWTEAFSQNEFEILNDFICESCGYMKDVAVTDISAWLEIAQHFGVPTRLLDFTYNSLVALYFACCSNPEKEGAVWMLDEKGYREIYYSQYKSDYALKSKLIIGDILKDELIDMVEKPNGEIRYDYPWIYKPMYRADRMNMQESVFLLWGKSHSPLDFLIKPENHMGDCLENSLTCENNRKILGKITIPAIAKEIILDQLDTCGINEKYVYPGLDGIGKYIRKKYSNPVNPLVQEYRSGGVSIELTTVKDV